jgi:type IV secretion system protein VirD4
MKNYAGHRLSPWLGHLMVSRQETSRPLLTAGEIMQLPPLDELVLVSGTAPIRGKKVRYFEDRELRARILAPPATRAPQVLAPPTAAQWIDTVQPAAEAAEAVTSPSDLANAGLRREPELPTHEEIAPPSKAAQEFEAPERPSRSTARRNLQRRFIDTARQASLDLGDDMGV